MDRIRDLFSGLRPVSLDAMNERAALQRRSDNKYLVEVGQLARFVDELDSSHEVLEIDGERVFDYESTYFDTATLRCFRDHVRDRRPRYKVRTRCYVTTGDCFFEVKVKREDGDTTKRHVEHDPDARASITPAAHELLLETLAGCGLEETADLETSLVTAFRRVTVVAGDRPERTTFDFEVRLEAPGCDAVELGNDYAIAETKTPDGAGAWDRALYAGGCKRISLSKYRVGTGLLRAAAEDRGYASELKPLFKAASRQR